MNIQTKWNLEILYQDMDALDSSIKKIFNLFEEFVDKYYQSNFKKFKAKEILKYIKENEKISAKLETPFFYLGSLNSLDTQNQDIIKKQQALYNEYEERFVEKLNILSDNFKKIGYDRIVKLANHKKLSKYNNYLLNIANSIKYQLDVNVENAISKMSSVIGVTGDLYNELSNSFTFEVDGVIYNKSEVYAKWESLDEEERRKFLNVVHEKYSEKANKIIFGNLYTSVCKSNSVSMKLRNISNVMEVRNISEEMENEVVESLITNVKSKYHLFHTFLKIKAKYLNKEKLDAHDVLAPVKLTDNTTKIPFEKGLEIYLDIINKFDTEFYEYSKNMVENGRLDVYPSENKRGGAYSANTKNNKNFILLNYTDTFSDVTTLAHEYGHAIHAHYSDNQSYLNCGHSLCLAETASIFNETLVKEYILNDMKSKDEKAEFIIDFLDGIFGTIFRQIAYTSFEKKAHEAAYNGTPLTYEDYDRLYNDELNEMFDGNINEQEKWTCTWQRVPHLYNTPFYCYSYAFGNILAFNLYKMYNTTTDKEAFKIMYKDILSSGESVKPYDLLIKHGIDIKSEEFYKNAFDVIEGYINIL